jgi:hypothetical protein
MRTFWTRSRRGHRNAVKRVCAWEGAGDCDPMDITEGSYARDIIPEEFHEMKAAMKRWEQKEEEEEEEDEDEDREEEEEEEGVKPVKVKAGERWEMVVVEDETGDEEEILLPRGGRRPRRA